MKVISIKLVSSLLAVAILAGCSSKKDSITYDDTNNNVKVEQKQQEVIEDNVDKQLSSIKTTDSNINDNNLGMVDKNSYMNKVTTNINGQNVTLTSIHFGFDNYLMRDEMLPIVKNNSVKISTVMSEDSNIKVKLEGNCDEWGTDEYNFALGLKRTKVVKEALINNGIKSSSIIVVSLGESNPKCYEQTASCWKQNRRVDHLLLP